jgi:hypothetical protein
MRTKTDVDAPESRLSDVVIRLREWGTHNAFKLPELDEITIGSAESCAIRIADAANHASRMHACIRRLDGRLVLRDLASKNGTRLDGDRRAEIEVAPGVEITIGDTTLVAESTRSIAVRGFLSRAIGWTDDRIEDVDLALRAVRAAAARRAPLLLAGADDLVAIAHALHRLVFGAERPFVLCDPRRAGGEATVRAPRNIASAAEALEAATGGSLCVWAKRVPADFEAVRKALAKPDARAHLIVCGRTEREVKPFGAIPIAIPPVAQRELELDRVLEEYAGDASASLGAPIRLTPRDRAWLREHCAKTLGDIEKGTRRLLALRHWGSVAKAAAWLEMSHVALAEWMRSRGLPGVPE